MQVLEMMDRSNFLVVEVYHERYFFSTECRYYENKTLKEVVYEEGEDFNKVEGKGKTGFYMLDSTSRRPLSQYDYVKSEQIEHISPSCIFIIDLNLLSTENDFNEFVWGKTNNKFGLYDIKED